MTIYTNSLTPSAQGQLQQRAELQEIRNHLIRAFSNRIHGTVFEHEEIKGTCRAVIRCTGHMFRRLVEDEEWQTRIVWFDARPEFETLHTIIRDFDIDNLEPRTSPDETAPIVCIIDTGVSAGNPFLEPVTREGLLRSFLQADPENPYDEFGHGSGVASLASYYALNIDRGARNQGKVWIAGARVLNEQNKVEEERLFSKVLAEVVETFTPLGVKIFNLSVNIINRKWNAEAKRTVPRRSWIARTIDRLSRQHDIVFIVSTGNLTPTQVADFLRDGKQYPAYFKDEESCIFDPGQAALALTVGALAPSTLAIVPAERASAVALQDQPAPFTRCGPGISKEIKPELVEFGGNYLFDNEGGQVRMNPGTSIVMASHQISPAIKQDCGTSYAAPRAAHKLALVQHDLQEMGLDHVSAPLLRAFLVNSASYRGIEDQEGGFSSFLASMEAEQSKHWLQVVGYGMPDHIRATFCDPYSALLYYQGNLSVNKVAYFDVPVPASLANTGNGTKRISVTVAYSPEVQRWGLEQYLGTSLKWRVFRGDVSREDIVTAMSVEEENAEQVDRPNEIKFNLGITLRSKGTVQHDVFEWNRHRGEYSANHYTLAIAAYEKWGRSNPDPIPYAVVVRLEDTTRTAEIYTEIENILAEIQVRNRVDV